MQPHMNLHFVYINRECSVKTLIMCSFVTYVPYFVQVVREDW